MYQQRSPYSYIQAPQIPSAYAPQNFTQGYRYPGVGYPQFPYHQPVVPYGNQPRLPYPTAYPQVNYPQRFTPQGFASRAVQYSQPAPINPSVFTSRINFQGPTQPQLLLSPQRQFASPPRTQLVQSLYSPPRGPQVKSQTSPQQAHKPLSRPPVIHHQLPAQEPFVHHKKTEKPQTQPGQQPAASQPQKAAPPSQPSSAKKDDDLEKRFAEAIQRTKNIVDKYQPNEGQQEEPQQDNENAEDPNVEELALQYEDGFIYRGQGIPPQTRQGFGVLNDQDNNEVYAGFWQDNFYHGEGRLNNLQQEPIEGPVDWNNLTSIGNGWNGYEGEFSQGKMHGQGVLFLSNGEKFTGQFQDGMIHGEGEFQTQDGSIVKGTWDQGVLTSISD